MNSSECFFLIIKKPGTERREKLCHVLSKGAEAPALVVMESTGGYEHLVAKRLQENGTKLAVMNPYRTHTFGKILGQQAKTDVLDATMLAKFAEVINPTITPILTDEEFELKQLVLTY